MCMCFYKFYLFLCTYSCLYISESVHVGLQEKWHFVAN